MSARSCPSALATLASSNSTTSMTGWQSDHSGVTTERSRLVKNGLIHEACEDQQQPNDQVDLVLVWGQHPAIDPRPQR
jgi:hypothetical protein